MSNNRFGFVVFRAAAVALCIVGILTIRSAVTDAGVTKTGGGYTMEIDALDAAGRTGMAGGVYTALFSAGQPLGYATMTGGTYELQGGFVSGIEAVFSVVKTISAVEAPPSYTGGAADPVPGARVTYLLTFTNYGEAADPGSALVEDHIPANATYSAGTLKLKDAAQTDVSDGDYCRYDGGPPAKVVCENFDVAAGESGTMTFKVIIE